MKRFLNSMAYPALVVEPKTKHTASMIILHGLGDSAHGWIDVAEELAFSLPHVRFILPSASEKPVTMNRGMRMPSWYDIKNLAGERSAETCDGLEDSIAVVHDLIAHETQTRKIPHNRVVLAGFSQGAAMSLFVGLQLEHTLGGVISMSGYLPRPTSFALTQKDTPVLFCHGDADPVVKYAWGQAAMEEVKKQGSKNVAFKTYKGMPHTACESEIQDVLDFVRTVLQ